MSEGYVYILTNEAMPGLIKVGRTGGSPELRAAQLHTTGVPLPFEVYASVFSPDCENLESVAHELMEPLRVANSREFFRCEPDKAEAALEHLLERQVSVWTERYLVSHVLVNELQLVDTSTVDLLAKRTGMDTHHIDAVLLHLTEEDLSPAVERAKLAIKERKSLHREMFATLDAERLEEGAVH